jgi:hypothetical protein
MKVRLDMDKIAKGLGYPLAQRARQRQECCCRERL